jgi:pseudouridine-5'-phosphate glycosidase
LPVLAQEIADRERLKGEVVLLVGPPVPSESAIDEESVRVRIEQVVADGVGRSAAVRQVAIELGISRNVAYEIAHRDGKAVSG